VKLTRFRKPKATCFLLHVEHKPNANASNINTYKSIQNMYPKVGLVEETKEEEEKERKIANNNEIYHICVGTSHIKN
jgi:hypothetical protein